MPKQIAFTIPLICTFHDERSALQLQLSLSLHVERIDGQFEGFPMFSPEGRYLVWCSNRNGAMARETNVFVAGAWS